MVEPRRVKPVRTVMRSRPPRGERGRGNKEEKEWKRVTGGFPRATSACGAHVIDVTAARRSSMTPRESGRSPNDATGRLLGAARVERSHRPSRVESSQSRTTFAIEPLGALPVLSSAAHEGAADIYYDGESPRLYSWRRAPSAHGERSKTPHRSRRACDRFSSAKSHLLN